MSSSISSRREFLAATAAVALPSAGDEEPRVFQAERELYCVVEIPDFRIVRSGYSRGEAEAYVRSDNYFRAIVGNASRLVIFRQSPQVQLEGEPIEVEGLPIDIEEELELAQRISE